MLSASLNKTFLSLSLFSCNERKPNDHVPVKSQVTYIVHEIPWFTKCILKTKHHLVNVTIKATYVYTLLENYLFGNGTFFRKCVYVLTKNGNVLLGYISDWVRFDQLPLNLVKPD